jgi:hypothetical protein
LIECERFRDKAPGIDKTHLRQHCTGMLAFDGSKIKVIFPFLFLSCECDAKESVLVETSDDDDWAVIILSCSVLLRSNIDAKRAPPYLAFMKKWRSL